MMKLMRNRKRIITMICLLVTVGILCIQNSMKVFAVEDRDLTGSQETRTYIDPPGTATTPGEEREVNTANTVTVSLDSSNGQLNGALSVLITLTLIAITPMIIILMTSFTRIIIVLHFTRAALNTQTAPPNQVMIGLALILTFFIMEPTLTRVNEEAIQPFQAGEITQEEAFEAGIQPLREFMYPQTRHPVARPNLLYLRNPDAALLCGVGVEGVGEQFLRRNLLHEMSQIHGSHTIRSIFYHTHVVSDK